MDKVDRLRNKLEAKFNVKIKYVREGSVDYGRIYFNSGRKADLIKIEEGLSYDSALYAIAFNVGYHLHETVAGNRDYSRDEYEIELLADELIWRYADEDYNGYLERNIQEKYERMGYRWPFKSENNLEKNPVDKFKEKMERKFEVEIRYVGEGLVDFGEIIYYTSKKDIIRIEEGHSYKQAFHVIAHEIGHHLHEQIAKNDGYCEEDAVNLLADEILRRWCSEYPRRELEETSYLKKEYKQLGHTWPF